VIVGIAALVGSLVFLYSDTVGLSKKARDQQPPEWNRYRNVKYGFEFQYPKDFLIYSDEQPASDPDEGSVISVSEPAVGHRRIPWRILITIHDHISAEDPYSLYQLPVTLWTGGLQQLVSTIWKAANASGTAIGPITPISIGGQQGYSMLIKDVVGVNGLGYSIDTENKWIFIAQNGWIFEIACPNSDTFTQMLQTFRFDQ
jgi:hypothetical protein